MSLLVPLTLAGSLLSRPPKFFLRPPPLFFNPRTIGPSVRAVSELRHLPTVSDFLPLWNAPLLLECSPPPQMGFWMSQGPFRLESVPSHRLAFPPRSRGLFCGRRGRLRRSPEVTPLSSFNCCFLPNPPFTFLPTLPLVFPLQVGCVSFHLLYFLAGLFLFS